MKGKRTDLGSAPCAISRTLQVIGDWWSLLILRDALLGSQRFSEFQRSIGLAKNILASRLKKLVDEGVLRVEIDEAKPSYPRYVLTKRGRSLSLVVASMAQWGEENCFAPGEPALLLLEKSSAQPFAKIELKTIDGQPIDPRRLEMVLGGDPGGTTGDKLKRKVDKPKRQRRVTA
jgi:DNA-binding HxlR family transcriptional regulator